MKAANRISLDRKPVLDLEHIHFQHVHSGIRIFGTWYMDPDTRQAEPCMVIMDASKPIQRKGGQRAMPCIILQRDMWKWTVELGDTQYQAFFCYQWIALGALPGTPGNMSDVFRIFDAIQSRLRDLWSMPPLPPKAAVKHSAAPIGDVTITERESGKTIQQIEVVASHVRH
ncbi:hypothetical protein [Paracoccus sp. (in: a-proteobacteria)]|uniref:hypothetical protein n=1 Tax=Paracoccus sp. TaxID=267 RepID=UPI0028B16FFC|nr:hypothetical protein [Paracoccus sp. (in: a-proteobacteria)]